MSNIRIVALGGLDENGKNLYCFEINNKILIINAGLKYPEENQYGVEVIIPDFSYIRQNRDKVAGIIVTHAHDDMMNGLPYLLREINVPVYGPKMCGRALRHIMNDEEYRKLNFVPVERNGEFDVAGFKVISFALTHSTPDALGIAIETSDGRIVVAEQFCIDFDMHDRGFDSDISRIAEIGKKEVMILLMESSYAEKEEFTSPKHRISSTVKPYFEDAKGRIFVTLYNQNYIRIKEVIDLAREFNRPVYFFDRKLKRSLDDLDKLGYYSVPKKMEISDDKFSNDIDDAVILITESGQSLFELMNRIATGEEEKLQLRETDTVIIASPVVPGTEKKASAMENELYRENVSIHKLDSKQILSVHPSGEDMKMFLYLLKPKYFIPVMGDYRNFVQAANIAMRSGFTPDRIIILDNGQVASFKDKKLVSCSEFIEVGDTMVGEQNDKSITSFVLKDRETLSTDGVIIIGVAIDFNTKELIAGPDIQSRGVIYVKDSEYVIKNVAKMTLDLIAEKVENGTYENMAARVELRDSVARYVLRETGKRPMILPAILEINVK